jgi:DNA gyrase subunit A
MLVLVNGEPKVCSLKEILDNYIAHQMEVITRRTRYDLSKMLEREHILKGLVIALANIDEVIDIIRKSKDKYEATDKLIEAFELSEKQANAILEMRLQRLTSLEVEKLKEELSALEISIKDLQDILANEQRVKDIVKTDLLTIKEKYSSPRKSELSYDYGEIDIADLIERQDIVISMTHMGYVKRIPVSEYKSQRRGGKGIIAHKPKDEDFVENMYVSSTHDDILFFTNFGKVYSIKGYEIPEAQRVARGRAIVNLIQLSNGEKVEALIPISDELIAEFKEKEENGQEVPCIIMATKNGLIKKTSITEFESIRKGGKIAISIVEGDELISVGLVKGDNEIIIASHEGKCIRFSEKDVRAMGRDTQGVRCMLISEEDRLVEMTVVKEGYDVLTISSLGFGKRSDIEDYRLQSRGGKGIKAGVFNDKTGTLVSLKLVKEDNDIMLIADNGIVIRTPACDISKIGRDTKGVKVMRIDGGRVVTVAVVAHQEDEKEEPVEGEELTETIVEGEVSAEAVTEEVTEVTAPASDEETGDSEE